MLSEGDPDRLPKGEWQREGLTLFADDPDEVGGPPGERQIDTLAILTAECTGGESECRAAFERLGGVWTLALSQQTLLNGLQKTHRLATLRYLTDLDQRWRAYLLGGRSLLPWELLVNSEIHRRKLADERGFIEPPRRQLLFLHPEAAYEYREWAENGLEGVLVLEAVGFYRWRWGEGGSMKRPWGGSLILSWDDSEDDSLGYGLMVHLPRNWSLGVVARRNQGDDELAVVLAADLPKLFTKTAKLRDRLRGLRLGGS